MKFACFVVIFLIFVIFWISIVQGVIQIVEPFPGHPVIIEGEKARITCVAYDIDNVTKPANISFLRVLNTYGDTAVIADEGKNGNYTFEQKTELNGLRLSVTMVINNMSSLIANRFTCSAWRPRPNDNSRRQVRPATYGFGIIYVPRKNLPTLNYSSNVLTEFNKPASLHCALANVNSQVSANNVKLDKIAWFKNNVQTGNEVLTLEDKLPNINLKMDKPSDAGKYTCTLFTTLGLTRKYNISGVITVSIKPRFPSISANIVGDDGYEATLDDYELIRKKGESVRFNCLAEGNPIHITWKNKPRNGEEKVLNQTVLGNDSSRYKFSDDSNRFKDFWLEIPSTDYSDRGEYSCCFTIDNKQHCQTFTLRVKDPLGWLWPFLGILAQVILIVLILVLSSYYKKSDTENRTVKQTDLSYTFTDDGGKGHIRLRSSGARTS